MNNDIAMFPILEFTLNDTTGEITHHKYASDGMTLRDYFAAKAMEGVLAGDHPITHEYNMNDLLAEASYKVADAMLKARNK